MAFRSLFAPRTPISSDMAKAIIAEIVDLLHTIEIPQDNTHSALSKKITAECMSKIKNLFATNPDAINLSLADGSTLLHYAVNRNNIELVRFLLSSKADFEIANKAGFTPVHLSLLLDRAACFITLHKHAKEVFDFAIKNKDHSCNLISLDEVAYHNFVTCYVNFHYKCNSDESYIQRVWTTATHNKYIYKKESEVLQRILSHMQNDTPTSEEIARTAYIPSNNKPYDTTDVTVNRIIKTKGVNYSYSYPRNFLIGTERINISLTYLGLGIVCQNQSLVTLLLSKGADANISMDTSEGKEAKITLLEIALLSCNSEIQLNSQPRASIIHLLLSHGASFAASKSVISAIILNNFIRAIQYDSLFSSICDALTPYLLTPCADGVSIQKTVNDNPRVYPYVKRLLDSHHNAHSILLRSLTLDATSFLARLPRDVFDFYLLRLIRELPPIDNLPISDAARAAAEEPDNSLKRTMSR